MYIESVTPETLNKPHKQVAFNRNTKAELIEIIKSLTDILNKSGPLQVYLGELFGATRTYNYNSQDIEDTGDIYIGSAVNGNSKINIGNSDSTALCQPKICFHYSPGGSPPSTAGDAYNFELSNYADGGVNLKNLSLGVTTVWAANGNMTLGAVSGTGLYDSIVKDSYADGTFYGLSASLDRTLIAVNTQFQVKNNSNSRNVIGSFITSDTPSAGSVRIGSVSNHLVQFIVNNSSKKITMDTSGRFYTNAAENLGLTTKPWGDFHLSGQINVDDGTFTTGANNVYFNPNGDNNTILEVGNGGSTGVTTPGIDFKGGDGSTTSAWDYNYRLLNSANDVLQFINHAGYTLVMDSNGDFSTSASGGTGSQDIYVGAIKQWGDTVLSANNSWDDGTNTVAKKDIYTNNAVTVISSADLKENIRPIQDDKFNHLEFILELAKETKTYKLKDVQEDAITKMHVVKKEIWIDDVEEVQAYEYKYEDVEEVKRDETGKLKHFITKDKLVKYPKFTEEIIYDENDNILMEKQPVLDEDGKEIIEILPVLDEDGNQVIDKEPVYKKVPQFDEAGNYLFSIPEIAYYIERPQFKRVLKTEYVPATESIPVTELVEIKRKKWIEVEEEFTLRPAIELNHIRDHRGLTSQGIKRVIDKLGIQDHAAWIASKDENGEYTEVNSKGYRPDELQASLFVSVEILNEKINLQQATITNQAQEIIYLKTKYDDLESRLAKLGV